MEITKELLPHQFIEDGFLFPYPKHESSLIWPIFGWESNMVDLALRNDDPVAFARFMRCCGLGADAVTFDGLTMALYCDKRGAMKCKEMLMTL